MALNIKCEKNKGVYPIPTSADSDPMFKIWEQPICFNELYRTFYNKMLMQACFILQNKQDAEDAVQIAFVRAYRFLHTFRGNGSLEGWLRKITVRSCFTMMKKRKSLLTFYKVYSTHLDQNTSFTISSEAHTMEILAVAKSIPMKLGITFLLHDVEGYRHREIAQILKITESASKSRLDRGRNKIREALEVKLV